MLADVYKQREKEKQEQLKELARIKDIPIEDDIVFYAINLNKIGGIETWLYNLSIMYDFTLVYKSADEKQLERLKCKKIQYVGQDIKCNKLINCGAFATLPRFHNEERIVFIHCDYRNTYYNKELPQVDKDIKIYAVSEVARDGWKEATGEDIEVVYNPVVIEEETKPLILGVFSRLTKEKGKWRINYLLDKLKACNKPFLMLIFTDLKFEYNDERVIFLEPTLKNKGWISKCDYVVQLSDTEAYAYTPIEALCMGIPVIITDLPMVKEAHINSSNAKILNFDMSNLDIDDLWNIPKFEYKPNQSKEKWEEIMKKKVFREKYNIEVKEASEENKKDEETPKQDNKKKQVKKTKKVDK